jgi:phosphohistidine phosphatase SixA
VRPTAKTRQRRQRRRLITLLTYIVVVFALAWFFESQGTTTIILVRHADVNQPEAPAADAPLNATGVARASLLSEFLARADVIKGVDAIYTDATVRTQQTAAPLAKALELEPEVADHDEVVSFIKSLLFGHKREIVLVVTQREDIAPLVMELHGSKNLAEIGPADYANIYIVSIPWFGKVKTLQLPYANGWVPSVY